MPDIERELAALAQLLKLPLLPDWQASLRHFQAATQNYVEYQLSLSDGDLALVSLGRGPDHLDTIAAYLDQLALLPEARETWDQFRRYAAAAVWGLKVSLSHRPGLQLYVKKPLPVREVGFWLGRQGISRADVATIERCAGLLDKDHTHFLGADFAPEQAAPFQVYFTQYCEDGAPELARLLAVGTELGLGEAFTSGLRDVHPLLVSPGQTVWVSLTLRGGQLLPTVKLDYPSVRLGLADMVLGALAFAGDHYDYLPALQTLAQVSQASYFGLRWSEPHSLAASLYLTRHVRTLR
ncbi:MAG: hypothetical protein H6651_11050 [Ardenticatenales bacterium]|nr:hypothetical protein [Ardenticatenales bacterium]